MFKILVAGFLIVTIPLKSSCSQVEQEFRNYSSINYKDGECVFNSSLIPSSYFIQLAPNLENKTFEGVVRIHGKVTHNTMQITLHCGVTIVDLAIKSFSNDVILPIETFFHNESSSLLDIYLSNKLETSEEYEIFIEFHGKIRSENGIFSTEYVSPNKTKSYIIATLFQTSFAQYGFPCIDDPAYKATFELKLARPQKYTALSNTPLKETSEPDADIDYLVWDTFEPTPRMSTYNLAFVICEYSSIEIAPNHTIWVPEDLISKVTLYTRLAPLYVDAMENFTGIKYPLKKLDHVYVPNMKSAAMENWGLITYRDEILLFNENISTTYSEQSIMSYMAHEVIHQWFGNLVTCKSWTYTWLNEGLTTFLQIFIADQILPEWKIDYTFQISEISELKFTESIDAQALTSLNACSSNPESLDTFGTSSYYKGAAIMRMMQSVLSMDILQKGLRIYLNNYSYGSVGENELWESLQEATGSELLTLTNGTIGEVMETWTHNLGFPVLKVHRNDDNKIFLSQEVFQLFRPLNTTYTWWIPLSYTTSTQMQFEATVPREWFSPNEEIHEVNVTLNGDVWILFNLLQTGYYIVNYDETTWRLLTQQLVSADFGKIHVLNRVQLLNDAFILALSGKLNYSVPLDLLGYLKFETEYYPWDRAERCLLDISNWVRDTPSLKLLEEYLSSLIENIYETISGNLYGDPVNHLLKEKIINLACKIKYKKCEKDAIDFVHDLKSGTLKESRATRDIEEVMFCSAVRGGGEVMWQFMFDNYMEEKDEEKRTKLFRALLCTDNEMILKKIIKDVFNQASYLRNDSDIMDFILNFNSQNSVYLILDYLDENFAAVEKSRGPNFVGDFMDTLSTITLSNKCRTKVRLFMESHSSIKISKTIIRDVTKVHWWIKHHYKDVEKWLLHHTTKEPMRTSQVNEVEL